MHGPACSNMCKILSGITTLLKKTSTDPTLAGTVNSPTDARQSWLTKHHLFLDLYRRRPPRRCTALCQPRRSPPRHELQSRQSLTRADDDRCRGATDAARRRGSASNLIRGCRRGANRWVVRANLASVPLPRLSTFPASPPDLLRRVHHAGSSGQLLCPGKCSSSSSTTMGTCFHHAAAPCSNAASLWRQRVRRPARIRRASPDLCVILSFPSGFLER